MIKGKKHTRTKALEITNKTKDDVHERDDGRCLFQGSECEGTPIPDSHYVRRSQSGLGIPENIWTACRKHHHDWDNYIDREQMNNILERHFKSHYPDWDKDDLVYNKWK